MDMSAMMGMGGMSGGMGSGSGGYFTQTNKAIARGYWYLIIAAVGLLACARFASLIQARSRRKAHQQDPHCIPSRPRGWLSRAYATATATYRELVTPQAIYFTGRISRHFSPMPAGQWLLLAMYWTAILVMLWSDVILSPGNWMYAYKWEKVGFRAAWVSVTQLPFIYMLSCKFSPITILTGISYERTNWLHRWAARTVFLTLIVHWSFFFREWVLADFVQLELKWMPMVKYGFGAWATIGWMVLSGFGFFRHQYYELFVAQHICAAAVLLWLVYVHVPSYARYNVYMAIGFVTFDWISRIIWNVWRNMHMAGKMGLKAPGYQAHLEPLPGDMVRLTIDDADFAWKAGQHAFLNLPSLRPFELHPFTIANSSVEKAAGRTRRLTMLIKARSGFSKSLHKAAVRDQTAGRRRRVFLSGPWGTPPDLLHYETVVLIACSTGASFIMPLLEDLIQKRGCVRRVAVHWIVKSEEHLSWFEGALEAVMRQARSGNLELQIQVHVTFPDERGSLMKDLTPSISVASKTLTSVEVRSDEASSSDSITSAEDEKMPLSTSAARERPIQSILMNRGGRPSVESLIRPPVEAALGETAVIVCGGLSITAQARTFVAALSDERAIHKGTGAQGLFLFTETYGW